MFQVQIINASIGRSNSLVKSHQLNRYLINRVKLITRCGWLIFYHFLQFNSKTTSITIDTGGIHQEQMCQHDICKTSFHT